MNIEDYLWENYPDDMEESEWFRSFYRKEGKEWKGVFDSNNSTIVLNPKNNIMLQIEVFIHEMIHWLIHQIFKYTKLETKEKAHNIFDKIWGF